MWLKLFDSDQSTLIQKIASIEMVSVDNSLWGYPIAVILRGLRTPLIRVSIIYESVLPLKKTCKVSKYRKSFFEGCSKKTSD